MVVILMRTLAAALLMVASIIPTVAQSASTTTLEGLPWRLITLPGPPHATLATLQRPVRVQFDSGSVSGFTGCNTMSGSYTVDGNQLRLGTLAETMMACPGSAATVESAFNNVFAGTLSYVITGNQLNLTTASGSVLVFEREAPPALTGRTWNVTGYNNGRQAVVSPIVGSPITLSFAEGRVSGRAGCNTFTGSYTLEGNNLKIGPTATTRMMCAEGLMTQERDFLKALESAVKWNVQGDQLDMHRADGERALEATPGAGATLTGRIWTVTGFNNGREGVVSPTTDTQLTLSFGNGRVTGQAGCNTYRATFTQQGDSSRIGSITTTRRRCSQNIMNQERNFLRALRSVVRWSIQGEQLDMHRADGQRAVTASSGQGN